ncbi:MAG: inositol monophosphatase [Planctomycetes bacterium]|nr:inositol monophosphatase [Planctomycetota bacterium]NUQ35484.1 inositol monophosphatase [Planctomycetaceae bacterium]
MDSIDPESLTHEAAIIGQAAGKILLSYFERLKPGQVEPKSSHRDLLTVADSEAEQYVIEAIRKRFPNHAILGEEQGFIAGSDPYCWVIDPLDGTTNFVHGFPFYAVSIGVLERGEPVAGVIEAPSLGETFTVARGSGTRLNGRRCAVSAAKDLSRSVLATGFSYNRNEVARNNIDNHSRLVLDVHDIRRPGAASIDLAYVAAGRFDGFWELYLKPWDVAAGALMVREAGGEASDFAGSADSTGWLWGENIVASNGRIHHEIRARLSGTEAGYAPRHAQLGSGLSK